MQIRVLSSTLVGATWHEPGVGNYEPELANFLIGIGAAEPIETKVIVPEITKKKTVQPSSASPPAPVSPAPIAKPSRAKRKLLR